MREYVVPFSIGSLLGVIIFIPLIALVDQVTGSLILGVFILVVPGDPLISGSDQSTQRSVGQSLVGWD